MVQWYGVTSLGDWPRAPLQRGARVQPPNDVTQQSAQNVNKSPGVATSYIRPWGVGFEQGGDVYATGHREGFSLVLSLG